MTQWLYPEVISRLSLGCSKLLQGELDLPGIQEAVRQAEEQIVAHDEKWLRSLLFGIENRIEEIVYTVSDEEKLGSVVELICDLVAKLDHGPPGREPTATSP